MKYQNQKSPDLTGRGFSLRYMQGYKFIWDVRRAIE